MNGEGSSGGCETAVMVIKMSYIGRKLHEMVHKWRQIYCWVNEHGVIVYRLHVC